MNENNTPGGRCAATAAPSTDEPTVPDRHQALREALAAGPTGGKWEYRYGFGCWSVSSDHSVSGPCPSGRQAIAAIPRESRKGAAAYAHMFEANARYIAAANPEAIRALLADLDAARAECERLRGDLEADAVRWQFVRQHEFTAPGVELISDCGLDELDRLIDFAFQNDEQWRLPPRLFWRAVETAPRDGGVVELLARRGYGAEVIAAEWLHDCPTGRPAWVTATGRRLSDEAVLAWRPSADARTGGAG